MTEFSPPQTLVQQNEAMTMDMRINSWSHRDHIKPIMARMFVAAAQRAVEIRSEIIADINATGISKYYYEHAKLEDDRSVSLSDLLSFDLYRTELPVEQSGIADDQQLSREYSVIMRVGGDRLRFGTDNDLDLWMRNMGSDGAWVGERAFSGALQPDVVPETVRIIERVETGFGTIDGLREKYRDRNSYTVSEDNYYLKTRSWIPNLSRLGRPDVELPKITDISFNYNTSYDDQKGHIDTYGSMSNDKLSVARRLARLTELASQFLDLGSIPADEMEPLRAITSARQAAL